MFRRLTERFLCLFAWYREHDSLLTDIDNLRTANQELIAEKSLLEDRLALAEDEAAKLWQRMDEALANERFALRTQINHAVQHAGGGIPYPDAHAIPATSVPQPQRAGPVGRRGRILPSQMADAITQQTLKEWIARQSGVEQLP